MVLFQAACPRATPLRNPDRGNTSPPETEAWGAHACSDTSGTADARWNCSREGSEPSTELRATYTTRIVPKRRQQPDPPGPKRTPPGEDLPEAVERIISRRQIHIEKGDVVIRRERVPRLNPRASAATPWRFRVLVSPEPGGGLVFTSFPHAASEAEQMAARRRSRVVYVEDDLPTLLADYRR